LCRVALDLKLVEVAKTYKKSDRSRKGDGKDGDIRAVVLSMHLTKLCIDIKQLGVLFQPVYDHATVELKELYHDKIASWTRGCSSVRGRILRTDWLDTSVLSVTGLVMLLPSECVTVIIMGFDSARSEFGFYMPLANRVTNFALCFLGKRVKACCS
jgi:hypothetical protein